MSVAVHFCCYVANERGDTDGPVQCDNFFLIPYKKRSISNKLSYFVFLIIAANKQLSTDDILQEPAKYLLKHPVRVIL